jgi:hypothetical protein
LGPDCKVLLLNIFSFKVQPSENQQGSKVVSVERSSFRSQLLIFIFKLKENLLFKFQKTGFRGLSQKCGLVIYMGRLLQRIDSGKPIHIHS